MAESDSSESEYVPSEQEDEGQVEEQVSLQLRLFLQCYCNKMQ